MGIGSNESSSLTDLQINRMVYQLKSIVESPVDPPKSAGVLYRVGYRAADSGTTFLRKLYSYTRAVRLVKATPITDDKAIWFAEPVDWQEHKEVPVIGSHIDVEADSFKLCKTPVQIRMFIVMYLTNDSVVGEVSIVPPDSPFDWRKHD